MPNREKIEDLIDSIQYIGRMVKRNDRNQNKPYEITKTQWFILRILQNKSCTIGQLAEKLEVRPSSMSQMIDRLELAGFVERQTDQVDARSKVVVLKEEGRSHLEAMSTHRMELLANAFNKLTLEEQDNLTALMEKFTKHLSTSFEENVANETNQ